MLLNKDHPQIIRYRSVGPILKPLLSAEQHGTVPNLVLPSGISKRDDIGKPYSFDVYYGMADDQIGVARLDLSEYIPLVTLAHFSYAASVLNH